MTIHDTGNDFDVTRRVFMALLASGAAMATVGPAFAASEATDQGAGKLTGGTLRLGFTGEGVFGGLEPHSSTGDGIQEILVSLNVFEPLTSQANDGTMRYVLAESITADDDSATVWTIRLKKGVLFHDGKELDAKDVIFSLQRISKPGTINNGNLGPVEKYDEIDKYTVRLTLGAPRSWLPVGLSDAFSGMVPAGFDPAKPVGTGPFRFGAVELKQSLTIERFDKYHGTPAVLDQIVIMPFADSSAQLNALTAGQLDVVAGLDPSLIEQVNETEELAIYNSPTGRFMPIQMRTDVAPFSDVRVRQALRLVLDRETVVNSAFAGEAVAGNDLYGRFDPDFDAALVRKRDVEKAKALIEEAGVAGQSLELVMNQDVATALVLAENAKEIGLDIIVKPLDPASFYGEGYFERPFFGGDYYPSLPYFMVSSLVDGPKPGLDQVRWRDEEYMKLWLDASATLDASKRKDLLKKMQEILFDRGAWIIAAFGNELAAHSQKVAGFPQSDFTGSGVYRALSKLGFTV